MHDPSIPLPHPIPLEGTLPTPELLPTPPTTSLPAAALPPLQLHQPKYQFQEVTVTKVVEQQQPMPPEVHPLSHINRLTPNSISITVQLHINNHIHPNHSIQLPTLKMLHINSIHHKVRTALLLASHHLGFQQFPS